MAVFDVSAEDVARSAILKPSWYLGEITKVEDGVTKTKGEQRSLVSIKILDGEDHEGNPAPGVLVFAQFMPAYPSFAIPFLNALGANIGKEGKSGLSIDENLIGRKLKVYVVNSEYDGKIQNKPQDYQPLENS